MIDAGRLIRLEFWLGQSYSEGRKITSTVLISSLSLAFMLLAGTGQVHSADSDVLLLMNDAAGVSLRYRPQFIGWAEIETPDRAYRTPRVKGASAAWPEGAPQLPVRVIWLAVPPGATVALSGAVPYGISYSSNIPSPVPTSVPGSDGTAAPVYAEDPQYYSAVSPFPTAWVEMQGPEPYRDLEVIRLLIYPFRFPSNSGGLLGLDSVDVRVNFQGGSPSGIGVVRPIEDQFYQGLIFNWTGPAKSWKLPRLPQAQIEDLWPSGDLYKIEINESGIYKLTYNNLVNAGINLDGLNPRTIRIFNNGGETLPKNLQSPRPQGPIENAIKVVGEGDGVFDPEDKILFYGKSIHEWEWNANDHRYQHYVNPYTDRNVYWLNINTDPSAPEGKRMAPLGLTGSYTREPNTTRAYVYEEKELHAIYSDYSLPLYMPNLFGDLFSGPTAKRTFSFYLEEVVSSASALLRLKLQYGAGSSLKFDVYVNDIKILYTNEANYIEETIDPGLLHTGNNTLRLEHLTSGTAYIDYFEIEYTRYLAASSGEIAFVSPDADGIALYQIDGLSSPWIFNVTVFDEVKVIQTQTSSFKDSCDAEAPRRYIALNESSFRSPLMIVKDRRDGDEYLNLRTALGADVLVIAPDEFYDAMAAYEAYRETEAPVPVEVLRVRVSDIFDEYGWGLVDPAAIRDFLKSTLPFYNWAVSPLYVLFVGDGDFDYKSKLTPEDDNYLIPFVSEARCTDDWYAYFTPTDNLYAYPQLALGRWPVRSVDEVEEMINRVITYEGNQDFGPWRDRMIFVADDEFGPGGDYSTWEELHTRRTEDIAEGGFIPDFFDVQKVYLTEYPVSLDPAGGGRRKPEANADMMAAIDEGCLIVNYMGHGNPTVWAHEHVFLQSRDLPILNNGGRLPLFIALTCDWAYWDSPFDQSMPEIMSTLPGGGAIASIAATRVTTAHSNAEFAESFYTALFAEPTGRPLGETMLRAKASFYVHEIGKVGSGSTNTNRERYHLLGDPVMKLAIPQLSIVVDSSSADTLIALDKVTVYGEVQTHSGVFQSSFQGIAHLQVFDIRVPVYYEFPSGSTATTYILPGNLIFRGDVSVQDGRFQASFVVPVDINYGGAGGRFSVYAYSDEIDGAGANDDVIYGESVVSLQDSIPPSVKVYFDSPGFLSGDPVSPQATLYVEVSDGNGVNLTGSAGHGIVVTIDDQNPIDLTGSFTYYLDSFTDGRAEHKLMPGEISAGWHTAKAIAWDAANNPNTAEISFEVTGAGDSEELRLTDVLNYPNPFKDATRFTFYITEEADVTIKVYTVAGRLIKTIPEFRCEATFNWSDSRLAWDGRDEQGDLLSNGVYIYKVIARGLVDGFAEETGRLIVMR